MARSLKAETGVRFPKGAPSVKKILGFAVQFQLSDHADRCVLAASRPRHRGALVQSAAHRAGRGSGAGEKTAPATTQRTCEILKGIGKTPVRVNQELVGSLVNRVQVAMFREIWDLLDRGIASAEEIDLAIRGSMGLRLAALGPFRILDFAGWDVCASVYKNLIVDMRSDTEIPPVVQKMIDEGQSASKRRRRLYVHAGIRATTASGARSPLPRLAEIAA